MVDFTISGLGLIISPVVYCTVGLWWGRNIIKRQKEQGREVLDDPEQFFASVIWPIGIPISFTMRFTKAVCGLVDARKHSKALSNLTRPIDILAMMVASRLLKNPEKWEYFNEKWDDGHVRVLRGSHTKMVTSFSVGEDSFNVSGLSEPVKVELQRLVQKSLNLLEQKKAADAIAERDMVALNAIEKMLS